MKPVDAEELYAQSLYSYWYATELIKELNKYGFVIIRKQDYKQYLEDIRRREDDLK